MQCGLFYLVVGLGCGLDVLVVHAKKTTPVQYRSCENDNLLCVVMASIAYSCGNDNLLRNQGQYRLKL